MPDRGRIAEWLLAQVMPPDRAVSAVGDWMEDAAQRGPVWFWSCVLRTAGRSAWNDLNGNPAELFLLSCRGWVYSLLLFAATMALIVLGSVLAAIIAMIFHAVSSVPSVPVWSRIVNGIGIGIGLFLAIACPFQVGRWLARRAPGREVAAAFVFGITSQVLCAIVGCTVMYFFGGALDHFLATHPNPDAALNPWYSAPIEVVANFALIAGALLVRRQSIRSATS